MSRKELPWKEQAKQLHRQGLSANLIARRLGVKQSQVTRMLNHAKLAPSKEMK